MRKTEVHKCVMYGQNVSADSPVGITNVSENTD